MGFWGRWFGTRRPAPAIRQEPPALRSAEDVRALAVQCGFGEAAALIETLARPCADMLYAGPGDGAPVGASRLGGAPDLPAETVWPASPSGRPLSFYGQVDLATPELAGLSPNLPDAGLLSLFVGAVEGGMQPAPVRALLIPAGAALARRPWPAPAEAFDDEGTARLNPVAVRFERRLSFPMLDARVTDPIAAVCPSGDIDALVDGLQASSAADAQGLGELLGQVLGQPSAPFDNLPEAVHFHEIGRPGQERLRLWSTWEDWEQAKTIASRLRNGTIYRPWSADDDGNVRWLLAHRAEIDAGVASWRVLMVVESNKPMQLWINDADPVYVLIRASDLARGDLSQVRAMATQG
ncbi:DUF1963 domain-containing protein [Caulobacter sp. KR2-114]|uniref:DUF1963 domain-containing protein n=1 Tax=Caulobacter sp. KR2-114 TaxID=3400912 RepID=UPI003C078986